MNYTPIKLNRFATTLFFVSMIFIHPDLFSQDNSILDDATLLEKYIQGKASHESISFDSKNIKQFWVEKNVISENDSISIYLNQDKTNGFSSPLLKMQLINVFANQDCKIEFVTDSPSISLDILDKKSKIISKKNETEHFLSYYIHSLSFHMEDVLDNSFYFVFSSDSLDCIKIKKIILSFSKNIDSLFFSPPGVLKLTLNDLVIPSSCNGSDSSTSFAISGKGGEINSNKKIVVYDNTFDLSVKIKNIGDSDARIYLGYKVYNEEKILIKSSAYPFKKNNQILTVVSSNKGSKSIIVDSYPEEWEKNCNLAINASDDLSDIPNVTLASGRIADIRKLEDGNVELIMTYNQTKALPPGTKTRIHGYIGGYVYTNTRLIHPGEEALIHSTIKKDDNFRDYSSNAFSRGIKYVEPVFIYEVMDKKETTLLFDDFTINY